MSAAPARTTQTVEARKTPEQANTDETIQHVAEVLAGAAATYAAFEGEVAALKSLLGPFQISEDAIRGVLGLIRRPNGRFRGTAHLPNAIRAEFALPDLSSMIRRVKAHELFMRAAYVVNAAIRVQHEVGSGETLAEALSHERRWYAAHEHARRGRLEAVAQVQYAADTFGWREERGTLVGWYLNPLLNNDPECIAANGHNFYAEEGTVIGLPGSVHNNCGCYAGPPILGAGLVNDAVGNLAILHHHRPKYKLKNKRRTA